MTIGQFASSIAKGFRKVNAECWKATEEAARGLRIHSYLRSDRRPWRPGYAEFKKSFLEKVIHDPAMLANFEPGGALPLKYGYRLDARVVEIPWVLARMSKSPGKLLDAGSSLNHDFVLGTLVAASKEVTILTLAPESSCFWFLRVAYLYGDLRDTLFKDSSFEEIACISTIEHVGMDNEMYIGENALEGTGAKTDYLLAIRELKRIIVPGGKLLISFPFGTYEDHGWFQQFDTRMTDHLIEAFKPKSVLETVFRYNPDGWMKSDRRSCASCSFFDVHKSKYFDPSSKLEYPPDFAAGERAVMCLELEA